MATRLLATTTYDHKRDSTPEPRPRSSSFPFSFFILFELITRKEKKTQQVEIAFREEL